MLVSKGIMDFPKFGKKNKKLIREDRSRLHKFHSTNDAFPGGILADEILTPGDGQIKGLIVTGGNPLITMANSNRLRKAFSSLELLVTLDIYPNETGMIGHYMLPCTGPLERPDLPFIFPLMLGLQTKPYLQATRSVVDPEEDQRDEASIYLELCRRSGVSLFNSRITQWLLTIVSSCYTFIKKKKHFSVPQELILNLILKSAKQVSFKKLLKSKHGLAMDKHQPGSFVPDRILTDDGKINMAPTELIQQTKSLEEFFNKELAAKSTFKLITKRDVTTHNSWTHNIEEFASGERSTNYLYMHSQDAQQLGLAAKDLAKVSTSTGSIILPVKYTDDLQRKTVAVPHGWGHQSTAMTTAKKTSGVNVNILAPDGIDHIETVSGMSQLTGFGVTIEKYDGTLTEHSWSGLPEDQLITATLA
jgi:formate dehydrogenase